MQIRDATPADARDLAMLINLAGEGIPEYFWQSQVETDETPLDVGTRRAARDEGGFSYRHARVCVENERVLGMALGYRLPDPYEVEDLNDCPALVRPLLQLEMLAPGSWYVNGIATREQSRGRGVARALMADSLRQARAAGCRQMSLIVASENAPARRLYESLGFTGQARRPLVPFPGSHLAGDWLLMTLQL